MEAPLLLLGTDFRSSPLDLREKVAYSALIDDLHDRGLAEDTLVVAMGEFGRTPKVGQITANGGTDAATIRRLFGLGR